MLKFLAVLLAAGILAWASAVWWSVAGSSPGDPVTSSANLDLKVRAQAGLAVEVTGMANRIRQVMAAGNEPTQRQPLHDELAQLHQRIDHTCRQLTDLGDPPAAIDHWLRIIGWPEFLALEREFAKVPGSP
jgi:hypothetical protein